LGPVALLALLASGCRPPGILGPPDTGPADSDPGDSEPPDPRDTAGPETIPDVPDPADALFSGEELPSFTIVVTQAVAEQLQLEYAGGEHAWVEATFQHDGRSYGPVGLRLKGENSFETFREKPSMKVDFNHFVEDLEFLGLASLTLNNMDNDYSMMHERVAYRVFREAGIPAYRASHALVYVQEVDDHGAVVSDRFYGLYALLEGANKGMIGRWFADPDGNLFEVWDVDFYDVFVPCPNLYGTTGCFQLEYGEDDRTRIQAVADAMELSGEAAYDAAAAALDWEDYLSYWAAGAVISQFDAYPYTSPGDDCHVYDDPTSGRLWFVPHGNDETFYYPDSDVTSVNGILARICKAHSPCYTAWKERAWEVLDDAVAWGWLAWFDEVRAQIEPWVEADQNRPYPDEYVAYYQDDMRSFIARRESTLQRWIGPRP
jgi:hypothetical protein